MLTNVSEVTLEGMDQLLAAYEKRVMELSEATRSEQRKLAADLIAALDRIARALENQG